MAAGIMLSSVVAAIWLEATGQVELSLAGRAAGQLGLWAGLGGAVLLASRYKGAGSLRQDFGLAFVGKDSIIGVVAGVGCQLLVFLIALLMRPVLGQPDVSGKTKELFQRAEGASLAGLVLFIVFVTVGAPLIEELFFRGLILRSIQRRFGPSWAVGLSALLFGLAHVQDLPGDALLLTIVSLIAVGGVLGTLVVKTGRLGPSIVAHLTFNAWTCAVLLSKR